MTPTVKTLMARLGIDRETAELARATMQLDKGRKLRREYPARFAGTVTRVDRDIYFTGRVARALSMLNDLLDGAGVECAGEVDMHDGPPLEYVNMGDTYAPTICRFNGAWRVCSWGDIVERNARLFADR